MEVKIKEWESYCQNVTLLRKLQNDFLASDGKDEQLIGALSNQLKLTWSSLTSEHKESPFVLLGEISSSQEFNEEDATKEMTFTLEAELTSVHFILKTTWVAVLCKDEEKREAFDFKKHFRQAKRLMSRELYEQGDSYEEAFPMLLTTTQERGGTLHASLNLPKGNYRVMLAAYELNEKNPKESNFAYFWRARDQLKDHYDVISAYETERFDKKVQQNLMELRRLSLSNLLSFQPHVNNIVDGVLSNSPIKARLTELTQQSQAIKTKVLDDLMSHIDEIGIRLLVAEYAAVTCPEDLIEFINKKITAVESPEPKSLGFVEKEKLTPSEVLEAQYKVNGVPENQSNRLFDWQRNTKKSIELILRSDMTCSLRQIRFVARRDTDFRSTDYYEGVWSVEKPSGLLSLAKHSRIVVNTTLIAETRNLGQKFRSKDLKLRDEKFTLKFDQWNELEYDSALPKVSEKDEKVEGVFKFVEGRYQLRSEYRPKWELDSKFLLLNAADFLPPAVYHLLKFPVPKSDDLAAANVGDDYGQTSIGLVVDFQEFNHS